MNSLGDAWLAAGSIRPRWIRTVFKAKDVSDLKAPIML
jgi:hypothetical protein